MNNDFLEVVLGYLIDEGALEIIGVDEISGETMYRFTPRLKEVMPTLYDEYMNTLNKDLLELWELGFINMDLLDDSNPRVTLTDKALDIDAVFNELSETQRDNLMEIIRVMEFKLRDN